MVNFWSNFSDNCLNIAFRFNFMVVSALAHHTRWNSYVMTVGRWAKKKIVGMKNVVSSNFDSTVCWLIARTWLMGASDGSITVWNWDLRLPFGWLFEDSKFLYQSGVDWKKWKGRMCYITILKQFKSNISHILF